MSQKDLHQDIMRMCSQNTPLSATGYLKYVAMVDDEGKVKLDEFYHNTSNSQTPSIINFRKAWAVYVFYTNMQKELPQNIENIDITKKLKI